MQGAHVGQGPLGAAPRDDSPDAARLADDVAHFRALAGSLAVRDVSGVDASAAAAAHRELRAACHVALTLAARLLARVEDDGGWAASGTRTLPEWVAGTEGTSVGSARRQVALGRALTTDLPQTQSAVAAGEITLEHAEVLTRFGPTSEARRAALASNRPDRNEAFLLDQARRLSVDDFRKAAKCWAIAVDAGTTEQDHSRAAAAEHLTLARRADGIAFTGFLTVEHADVITTALRAVAGVPAAGDPRSTDERRAHALVDLARVALDAGVAGAGKALVRPHVSVHVDWATYQQVAAGRQLADGAAGADGELLAPATLDDGEPLPPSALARIACDSEVTRVVFGPDSRPLDVGRTQRTYTREQRRAVVARDRHCQFPGCDRPPVLCEVHHVIWWSSGGGTAVDTGVLLCWFHHDVVHRRALTIRWGESGWEFRRADGSLVRMPARTGLARAPGSGPPSGASPTSTPPLAHELLLTG